MHEFHRSAAIAIAVLLAPQLAFATSITSHELSTASRKAMTSHSQPIELDIEDWVAFIRNLAPEYSLSSLGSGIEPFDRASGFETVLSTGLYEEALFTQVWRRP